MLDCRTVKTDLKKTDARAAVRGPSLLGVRKDKRMLDNIGLPGLLVMMPLLLIFVWLVFRALWRIGSKK